MSRRRSSPLNHYEREAWIIFLPCIVQSVPPRCDAACGDVAPFIAYGFIGDAYKYNLLLCGAHTMPVYTASELQPNDPRITDHSVENRGKLIDLLDTARQN